VNAALRRYGALASASAWVERELLVHTKGPGRQRGPVFMRELPYPILATLPMSLPVGFQQADHPLSELRAGMKISDFFQGDPVFVDSQHEPLVQVPDLIGWVIRRRLTHPTETATMATFRLLRRRGSEVDGSGVADRCNKAKRARGLIGGVENASAGCDVTTVPATRLSGVAVLAGGRGAFV
jgi:hypothetical protein